MTAILSIFREARATLGLPRIIAELVLIPLVLLLALIAPLVVLP